jgi:hypothetical protein
MKTTVDISDSLFAEARSLAEAEGITLRNLMEDGLRAVIQQKKQRKPKFHLRDGSVSGKGTRPGLDWPRVRDMIYEGRGN